MKNFKMQPDDYSSDAAVKDYRLLERSPVLQALCRSFVSFPAQQWPLMVQRPFTSLSLVTIMKQRRGEDRKTLPHLIKFMIELIE